MLDAQNAWSSTIRIREAEEVIYYYNKKKEPKSHDIIPSGKQNFALPKHYWYGGSTFFPQIPDEILVESKGPLQKKPFPN